MENLFGALTLIVIVLTYTDTSAEAAVGQFRIRRDDDAAEGPEYGEGGEAGDGEGGDEEDEYGERGLKMSRVNRFSKNKKKCTEVSQLPIPNDCNRFVHCPAVGAVMTTKYCPNGKRFDHFVRQCMAARSAQCVGICKKDGFKVADKSNKAKYFVCKKGIPESTKCDAGLVFEESTTGEGECVAGETGDSAEVVYEYVEEYE